MTEPQKILIVDDDSHIREVLSFTLKKSGYDVFEAKDGFQAVELFNQIFPDLIILDIMMPEMEGTDVCRKIRAESSVPIVFLSSKDDEIDRIVGLEIGGDDYVTKPFSPRELVARVRAVLRRSAMPREQDTVYQEKAELVQYGLLRLDQDRFEAFWGEKQVILTATEFGLLKTLMSYPGKVYSRNELMKRAYDFNNIVSDRTIDSHIRRVRKKFKAVGGDPIETIHGVGYRLGACK